MSLETKYLHSPRCSVYLIGSEDFCSCGAKPFEWIQSEAEKAAIRKYLDLYKDVAYHSKIGIFSNKIEKLWRKYSARLKSFREICLAGPFDSDTYYTIFQDSYDLELKAGDDYYNEILRILNK